MKMRQLEKEYRTESLHSKKRKREATDTGDQPAKRQNTGDYYAYYNQYYGQYYNNQQPAAGGQYYNYWPQQS